MTNPRIVCIVGASGSGKTTLIEAVVPALRSKGVTVATLKHTHHRLNLDVPGKDTWRHARAGAQQVALVTPTATMYLDYRGPSGAGEIASRLFAGADLVIAEGFKWSPLPKVEVFRRAHSSSPICLEDPHLLALVTDDAVDWDGRVFGFGDVDGIAKLLIHEPALGHDGK